MKFDYEESMLLLQVFASLLADKMQRDAVKAFTVPNGARSRPLQFVAITNDGGRKDVRRQKRKSIAGKKMMTGKRG